MNAGNRTANMMLMMVRAGASVPWITKFISQPIIKDYIQAQRKNESMVNKAASTDEVRTELSKRDLVASVLSKYGKKLERDKNGQISNPLIYMINEDTDAEIETLFKDKIVIGGENIEDYTDEVNELYDDALTAIGEVGRWEAIKQLKDNGLFTEDRLAQYILHSAKTKLDPSSVEDTFWSQNESEYNEIQAHILDLFLEYQRQSKDFQMLIRATSADTKGSQKGLADTDMFFNELDLVLFKNRYTNINRILSESIVSKVHEVLVKSAGAFRTMYRYENNKLMYHVYLNLDT